MFSENSKKKIYSQGSQNEIRITTCQPASCFIYTSICLFAQYHCCKTDSNITLYCQILTNACQIMVSVPTSALTLWDLIAVNAPLGSS